MPLTRSMKACVGLRYTVFQGTKPEPMEVEVLGVLHNVNGATGRYHPGAPARHQGGIHRRSSWHERQPGVLRRQVSRRTGLPYRRVLQGTDRWRYSDREDAGDQCAWISVPRRARRAASVSGQMIHARTASPGEARLFTSALAELQQLSETDRHAAGVFTDSRKTRCVSMLPQFAAAGIVPVMGVGSSSDRKAAGTNRAWVRGERGAGARRYGYRCHLHGHLYRSATIAGVRTSADAVRAGRSAHDEGNRGRDAGVAAQRVQDREHDRDRSARSCRIVTTESLGRWEKSRR